MKIKLAFSSFLLCTGAYAQGHDEFHDIYQHWKQPGTEISCCKGKVVINHWTNIPAVVGDCYPTIFQLIDGKRWIAKLDAEDSIRLNKEWIEVPDSKLLREKNPDSTGTRGHICVARAGNVLCAVPPTGSL